MSRHDELIRLRHMRDFTAEAIAISNGKERDDLTTDRLLELALIRLMEVIGEAAGRISSDTRAQLPDIPWSDAVSYTHLDVYKRQATSCARSIIC